MDVLVLTDHQRLENLVGTMDEGMDGERERERESRKSVQSSQLDYDDASGYDTVLVEIILLQLCTLFNRLLWVQATLKLQILLSSYLRL